MKAASCLLCFLSRFSFISSSSIHPSVTRHLSHPPLLIPFPHKYQYYDQQQHKEEENNQTGAQLLVSNVDLFPLFSHPLISLSLSLSHGLMFFISSVSLRLMFLSCFPDFCVQGLTFLSRLSLSFLLLLSSRSHPLISLSFLLSSLRGGLS